MSMTSYAPDQPMYLVNTGASASIICNNMLTDEERRSMQDPTDNPVQVVALNGDNIKVYGCVQQRIQIDDKLHHHTFLITALAQPLLGWDFLKNHHACIEAAPEVVHFLCKCPWPACIAGPMTVLPRWPPASRPMR